jgi:hypothetical protein
MNFGIIEKIKEPEINKTIDNLAFSMFLITKVIPLDKAKYGNFGMIGKKNK